MHAERNAMSHVVKVYRQLGSFHRGEYFAKCSCGWITGMRSEQDAHQDAANHHSRGRQQWRRCASCRGVCHWHDEAWVCRDCGNEWLLGGLGETIGETMPQGGDGATR